MMDNFLVGTLMGIIVTTVWTTAIAPALKR